MTHIPNSLKLAIVAAFPAFDAAHLLVSEMGDVPVECVSSEHDGVGGHVAMFRWRSTISGRSGMFRAHVSADGALQMNFDPMSDRDESHA